MSKPLVIESTQLDAPGEAAAIDTGSRQPASVTVIATVANVDTDVTLKVDHSDDDFTSIVETPLVTVTADGDYVIPGVSAAYEQIRPVFSTESGGTAATIDFKTIMNY